MPRPSRILFDPQTTAPGAVVVSVNFVLNLGDNGGVNAYLGIFEGRPLVKARTALASVLGYKGVPAPADGPKRNGSWRTSPGVEFGYDLGQVARMTVHPHSQEAELQLHYEHWVELERLKQRSIVLGPGPKADTWREVHAELRRRVEAAQDRTRKFWQEVRAPVRPPVVPVSPPPVSTSPASPDWQPTVFVPPDPRDLCLTALAQALHQRSNEQLRAVIAEYQDHFARLVAGRPFAADS